MLAVVSTFGASLSSVWWAAGAGAVVASVSISVVAAAQPTRLLAG